ncbi:MAG: RimK family alpha-L-glutamate ligase [Parcubacteria group bacterium]
MLLHVLIFNRPDKVGPETKRSLELLTQAAARQGHELHIIHDHECYMQFGKHPKLLMRNHKLEDVKVLIVKANEDGRNMMYRGTLIRQFELLGVPVVNKESAVLRAKNKLKTLQVLTKKKVPVPKSYVVINSEHLDEIVDGIGYFPVILKAVSGSGGRGVCIIESKIGLKSILQMIIKEGNPEPHVIQQYVKEAKGKDVRVFIVGKKIVGAMERIATKRDEFRSNFHLGGRVRLAELSSREKEVAMAAKDACGLDFAGVDIIRTKFGPKVLEVNSNPGLEGITLATNKDIAGEIIKFAVNRAKRNGKAKLM